MKEPFDFISNFFVLLIFPVLFKNNQLFLLVVFDDLFKNDKRNLADNIES